MDLPHVNVKNARGTFNLLRFSKHFKNAEAYVFTATVMALEAAKKPGWSAVVTAASHLSFKIDQGV